MHPDWGSLSNLQKMVLICARLLRDDLYSLRADGVISDQAMGRIENLLRNSLYEALWVVVHAEQSEAAQEFLDYAIGEMPADWDAPRYSNAFVDVVLRHDGKEPSP